jgi:hypothetical protein
LKPLRTIAKPIFAGYWSLENETTAEGKPSFDLKMGVKCEGWLSFAYGLMLKNMCLEAFDKCLPGGLAISWRVLVLISDDAVIRTIRVPKGRRGSPERGLSVIPSSCTSDSFHLPHSYLI